MVFVSTTKDKIFQRCLVSKSRLNDIGHALIPLMKNGIVTVLDL